MGYVRGRTTIILVTTAISEDEQRNFNSRGKSGSFDRSERVSIFNALGIRIETLLDSKLEVFVNRARIVAHLHHNNNNA